LQLVLNRIRQWPGAHLLPLAVLLAVLLPTTGCFSHTRVVQATRLPPVVMNATVEELVSKLNTQFNDIQSLTTIVEVVASVGGGGTGKVTEYRPFHGAIVIQKPRDLRVILQVPVFYSIGMDMVSDGRNFKLVIPIKSEARIGKDEVIKPSPKPLENLRPGIFFDSMLIQSLQPGEYVSLTESSRVIQPETRKHDAIEEPDYDLTIFRIKQGNILQTVRIVHFNRTTLLPYQQDIYDDHGRLATSATYDSYQKFGDIDFPTQININRPIDEYAIKITVSKATPNQKMEPDQFELCIPAGYKVQNMDDPGSPPTIAPSSPCGQQ
jgi:outer membrane lipoprotein-sorting protein